MQLTQHAKLRSAQRNISHEDIAKVIKYGSPLHRTGIVFYTIRRKDLEKMRTGGKQKNLKG